MTNKNNPADPKPANPKPTSPRKLASARANGAKSKGPKTAAASLQITHGRLAKTIAIWRQLRVWSFQSLDMAREIARQDPADAAAPAPFRASLAFRALCLDEAKTQSNSHRYEIMYERQYYHALKLFRDLKSKPSPTDGLGSTDSLTLGSTWETQDSE